MGLGKRVERFVERVRREDINLHGFILSVGGAEKAKAYWAPFEEGQPHRMYSVSKTMVALALGMLAVLCPAAHGTHGGWSFYVHPICSSCGLEIDSV